MRITNLVLRVVWVPLLSGCMMMGGMGHTGSLSGWDQTGHATNGHAGAPLHRAEASSDGLTIVLSVAAPSGRAPVAIDAWLRADTAGHEITDGEVWLRIQAPDGHVDQLRMQRLDAAPAGAYSAQYGFPTPGRYFVTAVARSGTGADARTVSVTAGVDIGSPAHDGHHGWVMPVAILGGLTMVAMMALMMGN